MNNLEKEIYTYLETKNINRSLGIKSYMLMLFAQDISKMVEEEINDKSDNEDTLGFIFGDVKFDLSKIRVKPWK